MDIALASVAAARSALYWLLADLFLTRPDQALIARLARDLPSAQTPPQALAREFAALKSSLPDDAATVSELAGEYMRLFGDLDRPGGAVPPYESQHHHGGDRHSVAAFYAKSGLISFETDAPPDHLGVEFRFMALLCHGESAAWRAGRTAQAEDALKNQRDFLDRHLLAWAPSCLKRIALDAHHPFYLRLAALAGRMLDLDRAAIDDVSDPDG